MNTPLLQIKDLHTDIEIRNGVVRALSGVDLHVNPGETLGIVGESGSGKTMTALSLMGLLPQGGPGLLRTDHPGRSGPDETAPEGQAQAARHKGRHDLPGSADLAEPDHEDRPAGV